MVKRKSANISIGLESDVPNDIAQTEGNAMIVESADEIIKKANKKSNKKRKGASSASGHPSSDEKLSPNDKKAKEKAQKELGDLVTANPALNELLQQDDQGIEWIQDLSKKDIDQKLQRARVLLDGQLDEGLSGEMISTIGLGLEFIAGGSLNGLAEELNDDLVVNASRGLLTARLFSKMPGGMKIAALVGSRTARVYQRNKYRMEAARQAYAARQAMGPDPL